MKNKNEQSQECVSATETDENNCDVQLTQEILSDLYKNVTMAQSAVKTLLPYVEDVNFTKRMHKQVEQYDHYVEQVGTLAETLNFDPTPAPKAAITMANVGIKAKMLLDKSRTHIAKIMMQGTLNGIIDLYRLSAKDENAHPDAATLVRQVLRYEESCLESMKDML